MNPNQNNIFNKGFNNSSLPPFNFPGSNNPQKQNKTGIITALYKSILGRDPDSSALMYYLSLPEVDENAIRKQMVESEEHKKILEEYKNIKNLRKEIENAKENCEMQMRNVKDRQEEIEGLNKLLTHKSQEITKIKDEIDNIRKTTLKDIQQTNLNIVKIDTGLIKIVKSLFTKKS